MQYIYFEIMRFKHIANTPLHWSRRMFGDFKTNNRQTYDVQVIGFSTAVYKTHHDVRCLATRLQNLINERGGNMTFYGSDSNFMSGIGYTQMSDWVNLNPSTYQSNRVYLFDLIEDFFRYVGYNESTNSFASSADELGWRAAWLFDPRLCKSEILLKHFKVSIADIVYRYIQNSYVDNQYPRT